MTSPQAMVRRRASCLLAIPVLAAAGALHAAAKPVEPNTWIQARTARADALYAPGESVAFAISLAPNAPGTPGELRWTLTLDGARILRQGVLPAASLPATVEGTLDEPGVLRLEVVPSEGRDTWGEGVAAAAVDPYRIEATAALPADFEAFWQAQKAELAKVPFDAQVTPFPQEKADVEVFDVSIANVQGLRVHGYLARPKGRGPLPAILNLPGMGSQPGNLAKAVEFAQAGFLAFSIGIHDLPNVRSSADDARLKQLASYPFLGREDRTAYYYRQVFLGVVQAVEYLASRPDWNGKALIAQGGSQGGALALVAAALDPRVTAVAAAVPALGEHTGPLHGRPDAAPHRLIFDPLSGPESRIDPKLVESTAYYDTCNFARFVKVPVVMTIGLIDAVVPPMTSLSIYNLLAGRKSLDLDPLVGHNWGHNFKAMSDRFYREEAGVGASSGRPGSADNMGTPVTP